MTILLGSGNGIAPVWSLRLILAIAIINIFHGVRMVNREDNIFWIILGFVMISASVAIGIFSILMYSEKSKYAPRISIGDNLIRIKEKLMRQSIEIPWGEIKNVNFTQNKIMFLREDSDYVFNYESSTDTYKSIKSAIKELAESKNIKVTGG